MKTSWCCGGAADACGCVSYFDDVQLWDHDRRAPSNPFNRRYQPLFSNAQIAAGLAGAAGAVSGLAAAMGAAGLAECERWIAERLDPVVAGPAEGYLAGVDLYLPVATIRGPIARGFAAPCGWGAAGGGDGWGFEPGQKTGGPGETPNAAAVHAAGARRAMMPPVRRVANRGWSGR